MASKIRRHLTNPSKLPTRPRAGRLRSASWDHPLIGKFLHGIYQAMDAADDFLDFAIKRGKFGEDYSMMMLCHFRALEWCAATFESERIADPNRRPKRPSEER